MIVGIACQWSGVPITSASIDLLSRMRRKSVSVLGRFFWRCSTLATYLSNSRVSKSQITATSPSGHLGEAVQQIATAAADPHARDDELLVGAGGATARRLQSRACPGQRRG